MLRPLLSTWYACAQQLGDVELSIKLLVEMLGHGKCHKFWNSSLIEFHFALDAADSDDPDSMEEDLITVLKVCSKWPFSTLFRY